MLYNSIHRYRLEAFMYLCHIYKLNERQSIRAYEIQQSIKARA